MVDNMTIWILLIVMTVIWILMGCPIGFAGFRFGDNDNDYN